MVRGQHLPGEEAWLIGKHRASGKRKYYLANRPTDTLRKMLAALIKARQVCEQMHQQMKEELGLDHFEDRSRAALSTAWLAPPQVVVPAGLRVPATSAARGKKHRGQGWSRIATAAEPARHPPPHPGDAHPHPPALPALSAALRPPSPALKVVG